MAKKPLTSSQLINKLQPIFNKFIRLRDEGKPCISCGEYKQLQAGHYYPVQGYAGLRFDEDNVHGECAYCNCYDEGHLIGYSENIKERIGETDYKLLKQRAEDYKRDGYKFGRAELRELIELYKSKIKDYEN